MEEDKSRHNSVSQEDSLSVKEPLKGPPGGRGARKEGTFCV